MIFVMFLIFHNLESDYWRYVQRPYAVLIIKIVIGLIQVMLFVALYKSVIDL